MKSTLKKLLALTGILVLMAPLTALAMQNSWELTIRNSDDTADTTYNLDRPETGEFHVLTYDPNTGFPSWERPSIFWQNILGPDGVVSTTTLQASVNSLQSQINGLGGPSFNIVTFMANQASTTPFVAATSTNGFMSGAMVTKLAGLQAVSTSSPSVSYSNRSLNTCYQISATKDAFTSYSVDVDTTVTLSGGAVGTVAERTYSDSGCTTDGQTVSKAKAGLTGTLVVGLTLNNPATVTLGGVITRGRYVKLETTNTTGTPTFTMNSTQEVIGNLTQ